LLCQIKDFNRFSGVKNHRFLKVDQKTGKIYIKILPQKSSFILHLRRRKWIIEDEEYDVKAKDVVIVPPGKIFYFKGKLKQICITSPAGKKNSKSMLSILNCLPLNDAYIKLTYR
jgi:hypothetical protein